MNGKPDVSCLFCCDKTNEIHKEYLGTGLLKSFDSFITLGFLIADSSSEK